jgi:hypothetical protein
MAGVRCRDHDPMFQTISNTLNRALTRQPPESLYHYTTGPGFLGIVASKEIWATSIHYMNDAKEFSLALEVAHSRLHAAREGVKTEEESALLDRMIQELERVAQVNVCVVSFSEVPDQLSQWRAYAGDYGFSLGLRTERLQAVASEQSFFLAPCIYDYREQESIIKEIASLHIQEFHSRAVEQQGTETDKVRDGVSWQFVRYLAGYAPLLKHASFAEEREWRLISQPMPVNHSQMAYRSGRSMLIPYFRLRLCRADEPLDVSRVTVGPTPHPRQAMAAVSNVFSKHKVTGWAIGVTSTPYRNW